MPLYYCNDGPGQGWVEIEADSAREAAQEFIYGGDYPPVAETDWVDVQVVLAAPDGSRPTDADPKTITVAVDPHEPGCPDEAHDWTEIRVIGHGGGVVSTDRCRICGLLRHTDTWAQRRDTGEQGLTAVSYETADAE